MITATKVAAVGRHHKRGFVVSFVVAMNRVDVVALNRILVLRLGTAGRTVGRTDPRLDGWVVGRNASQKLRKMTTHAPKTKIRTLVERYSNKKAYHRPDQNDIQGSRGLVTYIYPFIQNTDHGKNRAIDLECFNAEHSSCTCVKTHVQFTS